MTTKHTVTFWHEDYLALREAVVSGAFAERAKTLRTLIEANKGYQPADGYERELRCLNRAADALLNPTSEG